MCNISQPTKFKTKTVYKVVRKVDDQYYSLFSLHHLEVGTVKPIDSDEVFSIKDVIFSDSAGTSVNDYLKKHSPIYNHHMEGRTSGFNSKRAACDLIEDMSMFKNPMVLLKVVLGGDILKGTAARCRSLNPNYITYAGTEILSMEEI